MKTTTILEFTQEDICDLLARIYDALPENIEVSIDNQAQIKFRIVKTYNDLV